MYPSDTENPLNLERNGSENSVNLAVCSFTEIEKIQIMIFLMNIVVHHSIYGVEWGVGGGGGVSLPRINLPVT